MSRNHKRITALLCVVITLFSLVGIYTPVSANATDISAFPASYQPYIKAMIAAHPDWVFEPYNTGVDWDELVAYQKDKERSLIEKTSNPERYFSKAEGDYDAATGTYIGKSGANWVTPADDVIKHYLDPRNFLNDEDAFMFLKLSFNDEVHTAQNVEILLNKSWMHNKKLEDDSTMTYAEAFVKSGKETKVSAFFLAARVMQENGSGTSALISGTYKGYEGYYNYFNHGAYGSTETEIITNGLKSAKENGWNTRYKALYGGAKTLATKYIARNQYTLYFQKFDVVNGISYHQYMQNIQAPVTEGWTMRKTYKNVGLLDAAHVFSVPIYNNMPATACPLPGEAVVTPPASVTTPTPAVGLPPSASVTAGTVDKAKGTMIVNITNVVSESGGVSIVVKAYSESGGADDIKEYTAVKNSDGTYTATIDIANHGNVRGKYNMEVYISDNTYFEEFADSISMTITALSKPVLTVVQYQNTLKIKLSGFDSSLDIKKVTFPIWSNENGQDDLIWYPTVYENGNWVCTVNLTVHKSTEKVIHVHSYRTDSSGKQQFVAGTKITVRDADPLWGDVNFDGFVNAADALEVLKAAVALRTFNNDEQGAADVNFDGFYNAEDALLILKKAVGLTDLPVITW